MAAGAGPRWLQGLPSVATARLKKTLTAPLGMVRPVRLIRVSCTSSAALFELSATCRQAGGGGAGETWSGRAACRARGDGGRVQAARARGWHWGLARERSGSVTPRRAACPGPYVPTHLCACDGGQAVGCLPRRVALDLVQLPRRHLVVHPKLAHLPRGPVCGEGRCKGRRRGAGGRCVVGDGRGGGEGRPWFMLCWDLVEATSHGPRGHHVATRYPLPPAPACLQTAPSAHLRRAPPGS